MTSILTSTGRVPRSSFCIFLAVTSVLYATGQFFQESIPDWAQIGLGISVFLLSLISIIVQVKRWHDRDKSGWWVLINFVPVVGPLWALVECGFLRGTLGDNRFGPDPLTPSA